MITTIRLQTYSADTAADFDAHSGTTSCDFRGKNFIGDKEDDHHATRFEIDVDDATPAGQEAIATALEIGPKLNGLFVIAEKALTEAEHELGINVGIRFGVFDKIAPTD